LAFPDVDAGMHDPVPDVGRARLHLKGVKTNSPHSPP
jgi:hypothetical protein